MANEMNSTTNAVFIPEVIANEALGALPSYLNLGKTVAKSSDLTPRQEGDVISITKRGAITARQKSEGADASNESATATRTTVTLDQHWYVQIAEEDFVEAIQQGGTQLPGYVEDGVIALAEKIESTLIAHTSEFDNIDAGASAGDAQKGVIDVRQKLVENKMPILAPRYGYISPRFYSRLLKEEANIDPKLSDNQRAMVEGAVGRLSGFDIFEGQLTPTTGSPAWDQNFFYSKNALVLASRPLRAVEGSLGVEMASVQSEAGLTLRTSRFYDKDAMAIEWRLDVLFGTAVYDDRLGFVLESQ